MTQHVIGLRCVVCAKVYPADEAGYVCPDHGNDGILDVEYDYEAVSTHVSRSRTSGWGSRTAARRARARSERTST